MGLGVGGIDQGGLAWFGLFEDTVLGSDLAVAVSYYSGWRELSSDML